MLFRYASGFLLIFSLLAVFSISQISNSGFSATSLAAEAEAGDLRFGINYQSTNYHYNEKEYMTDEVLDRDFSLFKSQSIQFVVLNVIWKYFEPAPGVYNEQAIGNLTRVCAFAAKYDINVVVDFHTVVNKASSWTIPEWVAPRYFETVFTNSTVRQAWLNFLGHMTSSLNSLPNVESYQMMNEPARNSWACDVTVDQFVDLWTDMKSQIRSYSQKPVSIRFGAETFYHFNYDPRIYDVCDYFSINWYIQDGPLSQANLTAAVADAKAHNRRIMVSEFGVDTGANGDLVDEAGVTEQYLASLSLFRSLGVYECAAYFWRADYNSPNPQPPGTGLNLAKDVNGTPREAFYQLKNPPRPTPTPTPAPSLTVTSPDGGESWARGTANTIAWSSSGRTGSYVKIELLKAGVVNRVIASSTSNDGSYRWTISSTQATGTDYTIRVTSTSNSAIRDVSNGYFAITSGAAGSLTVNSPNGGENWARSTAHTITWASTGNPGSYVKIELLKADQVSRVIASNTANDGSYRWTVPSTQTLGSDYKVRVTSTSDAAVQDTSDDNFTVTQRTNSLTITSPNGGESWARGTTHTISWSSVGSPGSYVKIELLKAGVTTRTITSSTTNDGSYSWTVPSTLAYGTNYQIKISSTSNSAIQDLSNTYFTIR